MFQVLKLEFKVLIYEKQIVEIHKFKIFEVLYFTQKLSKSIKILKEKCILSFLLNCKIFK